MQKKKTVDTLHCRLCVTSNALRYEAAELRFVIQELLFIGVGKRERERKRITGVRENEYNDRIEKNFPMEAY